MPADEARTKIHAYAPGLAGWRATVFTRESAYWIAKHLTWFPSFGELDKLLHDFNAEVLIPRLPKPPYLSAPIHEPPTPEQIARVKVVADKTRAALLATSERLSMNRPVRGTGSTSDAL